MSKYYLATVGILSWGDHCAEVEEFDTLEAAALRSVATSYYDEPIIIVGDRVPNDMFQEIIDAEKARIAAKAMAWNREHWSRLKRDVLGEGSG